MAYKAVDRNGQYSMELDSRLCRMLLATLYVVINVAFGEMVLLLGTATSNARLLHPRFII